MSLRRRGRASRHPRPLSSFSCRPRRFAAEEILLYRSDVDVRANGDLFVTETIRVNAEGATSGAASTATSRSPSRMPTAIRGRNAFELISAKRDGAPETYRLADGSDLVRVYLGKEDVFLDHGVHTYELTYRTDRQVRFFGDHDEVYWNATGTEWIFPIRQAVAVIDLPDGATRQGHRLLDRLLRRDGAERDRDRLAGRQRRDVPDDAAARPA